MVVTKSFVSILLYATACSIKDNGIKVVVKYSRESRWFISQERSYRLQLVIVVLMSLCGGIHYHTGCLQIQYIVARTQVPGAWRLLLNLLG